MTLPSLSILDCLLILACHAVALPALAASLLPGSFLASMHTAHGVGFSGVLYGFQASNTGRSEPLPPQAVVPGPGMAVHVTSGRLATGQHAITM